METPTTLRDDARESIKKDLEYYRKKLAHYEKTKNLQGIKVCKLLLDKYLDQFNNT
jgi:hypothetical protein